VSCPVAGSCAAGGYYSGPGSDAFVAVERHGRWTNAIEVPGLAALNNPDFGAGVNSVSCASPTSCVAGGSLVDRSRSARAQGFVVAERNGRWSKAVEVPGLAALNQGNPGYGAQVISISCASAGNCTYGGYYQARHSQQGFVAVERHGVWGKAIEVPGLSALSNGGGGPVDSVSCSSAGNCAAGGTALVIGGGWEGFVVVERNGRWGKATGVPGLTALNTGRHQPFAQVTFYPTVSCAPAGPCTVGGSYTDASNNAQGFLTQTR
jgi:hypothetical protein